MAKKLFDPQDAPVAKFATFYCTIGDRRYEMLNAKNFEAKANVETADVPRLGSVIKGKKAVGLEVKLSFTVYKVSEMFDELILRNASYTYRDVIVASLQPNGISKKGWKELTADRDRHFKKVLPVRLYDSLKQDRIQKRMSAQQGELFEKILYLSSSPKMMAVVNSVVSHLYNFLVRRNKGK